MVSHRHTTARPDGESRRPATPRDPVVPDPTLPEPGRLDDPLLAAAYTAVMDLGPSRTTMAEVARRAGVSRMTLYRRYDDLSRVLAALLAAELGAVVDAVTAEVAPQPTARARLVAAVAATTRAVARHPLMRRVLELDPDALLPLVVDRLGSTQRHVRELLVTLVRAGQRRHDGDGSIREGDADLLALTLLVTAQSFIFSARVVDAADPRAYDELAVLVDRYLEEAA